MTLGSAVAFASLMKAASKMTRSATLIALLLSVAVVFAVRDCCMPALPNPAQHCSHSEPNSRGDGCDGNQEVTAESVKVRAIRPTAEAFLLWPQLVERFSEAQSTTHANIILTSLSPPAAEHLFLCSCAFLI